MVKWNTTESEKQVQKEVSTSPSRTRECQASTSSAASAAHSRRSANSAHSAFQGAPRASPQSSGGGRHFRRVAARPRGGWRASASGENGNFRGEKRAKSPPHHGWPPSEWARGTRYGRHQGRFATFDAFWSIGPSQVRHRNSIARADSPLSAAHMLFVPTCPWRSLSAGAHGAGVGPITHPRRGQQAAPDIGCHEEQQDEDDQEPPGPHLQEPAAAHHPCFPGYVSRAASSLVT